MVITITPYYTEHSPSWEANRFSSSQEILCILWEPKFHSQVPATCPYPEPAKVQVRGFLANYT